MKFMKNIIIFSILDKSRSVGPVKLKINLVSPNYVLFFYRPTDPEKKFHPPVKQQINLVSPYDRTEFYLIVRNIL